MELISIALVPQAQKHHAQLALLVLSPNNSALWAVSLMTLELAVQQASSAQKPQTMTLFYVIQELITLVQLERPKMTAQIAQQANGVLQDQPAKPALAPALMALTVQQERSFLMSMDALLERPRLVLTTQLSHLIARTAL